MTPAELEAAYIVEPLSNQHDRKIFACGKGPLDRYLRQQAMQEAQRHVAATTGHPSRPTRRGRHTQAPRIR